MQRCSGSVVLGWFATAACLLGSCFGTARAVCAAERTPNVVLIFCDDLGYGDIGPYGSKNPTPHLDQLARDGMRLTDFYVPQAVCSASRVALMTGCYPNRVGVQGALSPNSKIGLHPDEVTIAEVAKSRGYATAMVGKWHLGDSPQFLPTQQGFDEYFGLLYSNDMWPHHPTNKSFPPLQLIDGEKAIETIEDQSQLTSRYTERAVEFIERNRERPFFLYVAHSMPHVPLYVSDKHRGKSGLGLYGDVILEIDWSVGEVLKSLEQHGLDDDTLVIFTSDNGPWLLYGNHGGSAGELREGKGTEFEGGVRVPCLMRWPNKIKAGSVCQQIGATFDLLPTVAAVIGAPLDHGRKIDGVDLSPLLLDKTAGPVREHLALYYGLELQAVRSGKWKLHFPHRYPKPNPAGGDAKPGKYSVEQIEQSLYDLHADLRETTNVAAEHPDVVVQLTEIADGYRAELGDALTDRKGTATREPGHVALRALPRAHAHNDYEHRRPLYDALDHGFTSVEADIWLKNGKLLVAHDAHELKEARTLESLYLDPLLKRVRENQGRVFADGPPFWLLIDLKSDAETTYQALHEMLSHYEEMLSSVRDGEVTLRGVNVVISGNRPVTTMASQRVRFAGVDGRLSDLDSDIPAHVMPMISDRWGAHFRWNGDGPMPEEEQSKLRDIVAKAHARGRIVRFWATPEEPAVWEELRAADVDLINTDQLGKLRSFLSAH